MGVYNAAISGKDNPVAKYEAEQEIQDMIEALHCLASARAELSNFNLITSQKCRTSLGTRCTGLC